MIKIGCLKLLANLKIELTTNDQNFSVYKSSNMHGLLMELIDTNYAEILHNSSINPYSQFLEISDKCIWHINTLTEESYLKIIKPILDSKYENFLLKKNNIILKIISKTLVSKPKDVLVDNFYRDNGPVDRYINIKFITPTSFKSNNKYVNFPDLKLIYQSLMNKFSTTCSEYNMNDEETLLQLTENSSITRYNLRSASFSLENTRIPAFIGTLTVRINGPETMARYAKLLVDFGQFSGVGIKTSLGMGAFQIIERKSIDGR